ncbi:MAG: ABC transporter ATP-binding protein, partial [Parvularcula sp.]|nr:ABC transporter ATP-binding protein [Parvularcula sp.]
MSITFAGVTVAQGNRTLLSNTAGQIAEGRLTALIGPNGAGKTTLLRALLGLCSASGEMSVGSQALAGLSRQERARLIGYLPQKREAAWPLLCRDLVALGLHPHGGLPRGDKAQRRIREAMIATGTEHLMDRPCDRLSGGEEARVHLARAMVSQA